MASFRGVLAEGTCSGLRRLGLAGGEPTSSKLFLFRRGGIWLVPGRSGLRHLRTASFFHFVGVALACSGLVWPEDTDE